MHHTRTWFYFSSNSVRIEPVVEHTHKVLLLIAFFAKKGLARHVFWHIVLQLEREVRIESKAVSQFFQAFVATLYETRYRLSKDPGARTHSLNLNNTSRTAVLRANNIASGENRTEGFSLTLKTPLTEVSLDPLTTNTKDKSTTDCITEVRCVL